MRSFLRTLALLGALLLAAWPADAAGPGITLFDMNGRPVGSSIFFAESSVPLPAGGIYAGPVRNDGFGAGVPSPYSYFQAVAYADQPGTLTISCSFDGATFYPVQTRAVPSGGPVMIWARVPRVSNLCQVSFANGSAAQGVFFMSSSFSAN